MGIRLLVGFGLTVGLTVGLTLSPAASTHAARTGSVVCSAARPSVGFRASDEFRHGHGGDALASSKAIDGSVAMMNVDGPATPSKQRPRPAAGVPLPASPSNTFRYGAGGPSLAATRAIDGTVAMMHVPNAAAPPAMPGAEEAPPLPAAAVMAPPAASAATAPPAAATATTAPPEPVPVRGRVVPTRSADEFRHGSGGQALASYPACDGSVAMVQ